MTANITLPASSPLAINPFSGCNTGANAYDYLSYHSKNYMPNNHYKVSEQIEMQKDYLFLLKKINKIDPEAKEIIESPINGSIGTYNGLNVRSFLSDNIWSDKKLQISYSVKNGFTSSLSVFKDFKFNGISVKLYACYDIPIITRVGLEHIIQNSKLLENKNIVIAKKIFQEIVLFVKSNQLKISSESEISPILSNYLNFI